MIEEIREKFLEESDGGRRWVWFELGEKSIKFLDQRYLPLREIWVGCYGADDVARAIKDMVLRGAPAIGIAAAFGVFYEVKKMVSEGKYPNEKEFSDIVGKLLNTRPTAYNLKKALDDMCDEFLKSSKEDLVERLERKAKEIWFQDYVSCHLIGENGSKLLDNVDYVFTICNTGSLATGGWGTAFSVIKKAFEKGKKFLVFALETRPFLQGARLTAWELIKNKIDFKLIVDSSAPFVMSKYKNSCVLTGADRILKDGTTSNKIGTLMLAISSNYFSIPFYVCAPKTTIDTKSEAIPIEERDEREVKEVFGVKIAPENSHALNYSFDITPPSLISAIITEDGVFTPPYLFE